jgi:hypothetical protein
MARTKVLIRLAGCVMFLSSLGCRHEGSDTKNFSPSEEGDSVASYEIDSSKKLIANFGFQKCDVAYNVTSIMVPPNPSDEAVLYFLRSNELMALRKVEHPGGNCPSFESAKVSVAKDIATYYAHPCFGEDTNPNKAYSIFAFNSKTAQILRIENMNSLSNASGSFASMDDFLIKEKICKKKGGSTGPTTPEWDGNDAAASVCLGLAYASEKEACVNTITGKNFQKAAVEVCAVHTYDSSKTQCFAQIANNRYPVGGIEICKATAYDSSRKDCMAAIKGKTYSDTILTLCKQYEYDSSKIECLKNH